MPLPVSLSTTVPEIVPTDSPTEGLLIVLRWAIPLHEASTAGIAHHSCTS